MILTFDCGNTMIKIGLFDNDNFIKSYSINTDKKKSSDEYSIILKTLISSSNYHIDGAIISCVVPSLNEVLKASILDVFGVNALVVGKSLKTKLPIKIDNPSELGADMLSGAVGAAAQYHHSILVADLGTATKLYVIDKNGNFVGGVITSGIQSSMRSLVSSTSLLMEVPLNLPNKIIGKNTVDSIQSGILNSQIFLINGFAESIEKELGYPLKKIITGGFCRVLAKKIENFEFIDNLVLKGLYHIYKVNMYEKR